MGAHKKYTPKQFERAVDDYFKSICRRVPATELYDTGNTNKKGYPIMATRQILRDDGTPFMVLQWIEAPGIAQLCDRLGISKQTFENYTNDPKYVDSTMRARMRIEAYLTAQLEIAKNPSGVMFNLMNNFKWSNKNTDRMDAKVKFTISEDADELSD